MVVAHRIPGFHGLNHAVISHDGFRDTLAARGTSTRSRLKSPAPPETSQESYQVPSGNRMVPLLRHPKRQVSPP